ncbi:MAG: LysR family transcriptional regulator [Actinomycetota bacterium]|nr:LysR family transcriptional regulator [Actinomycetota bacterium]
MSATTLQQLRYVIEIANCGSINEAAKKLFISQPSLSNALKELEDDLGIIIFERTNKGVSLSLDGVEFIGYARQVVEQADLMESRYSEIKSKSIHFSVSTQHYSFAAKAFTRLVKQSDLSEYEFSLKETKTHEIIDNVKTLRSDIGILYINEVNSKVMNKIFSDNSLKFTPLFNASPHVLIRAGHLIAGKKAVLLEDMQRFPYIAFDQGENNSFYFSEEALNILRKVKGIKVSDRATLLDLLANTDGFTISAKGGISDLKDERFKSIPIEANQIFTVGWISHKNISLSDIAKKYIFILNDLISEDYFDLDFYLL